MNSVFIDAGAFIALASRGDEWHVTAERIYRSLVRERVKLITSNHIIDETCTWLLRDATLGHPSAMGFAAMLASASAAVTTDELLRGDLPSKQMLVVYSSPAVERSAWDILAKYDTAGFSFTDCTSFALMALLHLDTAFAFDSHFDLMGYHRLVPASL